MGWFREALMHGGKWFIRQRTYFNRGNSYWSTAGQFAQFFILIGVWMDKIPFTITGKMIFTGVVIFIIITHRVGQEDYKRGVARYEHEWSTRLNPYYNGIDDKLDKILEKLDGAKGNNKKTNK